MTQSQFSSLSASTSLSKLYGNFSFLSRVPGSPHLLQWNVEQEGNIAAFLIGNYPYSTVIDGEVNVTIVREDNVKWIITYREYHDAYT